MLVINSSFCALWPSKQPPKSKIRPFVVSGRPGAREKKTSSCLMAFVVSCVVREPRKYRQNQQVAEIEDICLVGDVERNLAVAGL